MRTGAKAGHSLSLAVQAMTDASDPETSASTSSNSLVTKAPDSLIKREPRLAGNVLLASTIDGGLHAINRFTGQLLWSSQDDLGGPLIKGMSLMNQANTETDAWALSREANFFIEPLFPGGLYIYVPGDILQVTSLPLVSYLDFLCRGCLYR